MTYSVRLKNGGTLEGPSIEAVQRVAAAIERGHELRARWPADGRAAMVTLAAGFPSLHGVPGCNPWDAGELVAWLNGGAPTSGSRHAAMFLLNVWNCGTDWRAEGLRVKAGLGRFNFAEAIATWDEEHRAACAAWLAAPFHP